MRACALACALSLALRGGSAVRYDCPPAPNCSWARPARYTGRFAVVVSGQIRAAHNQLPTLRALVARHAARGRTVDVVYHVWRNASAPCDDLALREARACPNV